MAKLFKREKDTFSKRSPLNEAHLLLAFLQTFAGSTLSERRNLVVVAVRFPQQTLNIRPGVEY